MSGFWAAGFWATGFWAEGVWGEQALPEEAPGGWLFRPIRAVTTDGVRARTGFRWRLADPIAGRALRQGSDTEAVRWRGGVRVRAGVPTAGCGAPQTQGVVIARPAVGLPSAASISSVTRARCGAFARVAPVAAGACARPPIGWGRAVGGVHPPRAVQNPTPEMLLELLR